MIKALKKKYALSDQGAKDLLKGIVYSVLANISPVSYTHLTLPTTERV